MKNLYLISQEHNNDYDTYDSAVVVSQSRGEARLIHPNGYGKGLSIEHSYSWVPIEKASKIEVELIGVANESQSLGEVICASFNAG